MSIRTFFLRFGESTLKASHEEASQYETLSELFREKFKDLPSDFTIYAKSPKATTSRAVKLLSEVFVNGTILEVKTDDAKRKVSDEILNNADNVDQRHPKRAKVEDDPSKYPRALEGERLLIRLSGIPFRASGIDIRDWISPHKTIDNSIIIRLDTYGHPTGDCFAEFIDRENYDNMLKRNGELFENEHVKVYPSKEPEYDLCLKVRTEFMRNNKIPSAASSRNSKIIRLRNLPWEGVTDADIRIFFAPVPIVAAHIPFDNFGRQMGEAFVEVMNDEAIRKCLAKLGKICMGKLAEIKEATVETLDMAMENQRIRKQIATDQRRKYDEMVSNGYKGAPPMSITQGQQGYAGLGASAIRPQGGSSGRSRGVRRDYRDRDRDTINCGEQPSIAPGDDRFLRMRGLPWGSTEETVSSFFQKVDVLPSYMHMREDCTEAFIEFATSDDCEKVRSLHRTYIGRRYIELYSVPFSEMSRIITRTTPFPSDMNSPRSNTRWGEPAKRPGDRSTFGSGRDGAGANQRSRTDFNGSRKQNEFNAFQSSTPQQSNTLNPALLAPSVATSWPQQPFFQTSMMMNTLTPQLQTYPVATTQFAAYPTMFQQPPVQAGFQVAGVSQMIATGFPLQTTAVGTQSALNYNVSNGFYNTTPISYDTSSGYIQPSTTGTLTQAMYGTTQAETTFGAVQSSFGTTQSVYDTSQSVYSSAPSFSTTQGTTQSLFNTLQPGFGTTQPYDAAQSVPQTPQTLFGATQSARDHTQVVFASNQPASAQPGVPQSAYVDGNLSVQQQPVYSTQSFANAPVCDSPQSSFDRMQPQFNVNQAPPTDNQSVYNPDQSTLNDRNTTQNAVPNPAASQLQQQAYIPYQQQATQSFDPPQPQQSFQQDAIAQQAVEPTFQQQTTQQSYGGGFQQQPQQQSEQEPQKQYNQMHESSQQFKQEPQQQFNQQQGVQQQFNQQQEQPQQQFNQKQEPPQQQEPLYQPQQFNQYQNNAPASQQSFSDSYSTPSGGNQFQPQQQFQQQAQYNMTTEDPSTKTDQSVSQNQTHGGFAAQLQQSSNYGSASPGVVGAPPTSDATTMQQGGGGFNQYSNFAR